MIVAEGVGKTYSSGGRPLVVLDGIDLEIASESVVAIVGPSGSGTTPLLGLLAGLDAAEFRARRIGFVFQTFHLLPTMTALENVMVPLELQGSFDGARERARDLLQRVGLGDREDHYPAQLSGGEQQRVALARAFSNRPAILFADEPTGNLDQTTGSGIVEMLEALNTEERTTLILVTHDPSLAERADRVVTLSGGRIASDRPGSGRRHRTARDSETEGVGARE